MVKESVHILIETTNWTDVFMQQLEKVMSWHMWFMLTAR